VLLIAAMARSLPVGGGEEEKEAISDGKQQNEKRSCIL